MAFLGMPQAYIHTKYRQMSLGSINSRLLTTVDARFADAMPPLPPPTGR